MALPNNAVACGNIRGIEYIEAEGTGEYAINWEDSIGTRIFYIDWADRTAFISELLGFDVTNADNTDENKINPQKFPGYDFLVCTQVNVKGLGEVSNAGGVAAYQFAEVTAEYSTRIKDDIVATLESNAGYETLDINGVGLYYTTSGKDVADAIKGAKRIPIARQTLTIERTNISPYNAIGLCIGRINQNAYLGASAQTLLYEGAVVTRTASADGKRPYRVVHTFLQRLDSTWQQVWDDYNQIYDTVKNATNAADPYMFYEEIDFDASNLIPELEDGDIAL